MPHVTVEYTSNLKAECDLKALLKKINETLIAAGGIFPVGGIRSRAIELHDYFIADGADEDDAFVHVTLKIGAGRSAEEKKVICDRLFKQMESYFEGVFETRYLALSMELYEFGAHETYKKNNIHQRYTK
ncbi:5-carboxymethyl-2-hydroxymuconate Delta-isomerase [Virgibacillus sp. C22-A2]|uniref:5-carboxymethyl-2-hydroxymuconate Delta-isomerase n=1 Tax=Virgibacillus tibetensis TaxID=3042313 RepID=A0ABU6KCZ3_9BACI|nr:5-carboxymethyl-2-hydroxymuconate Delta-isomerase [Virgibacillus sp. C22-A2]